MTGPRKPLRSSVAVWVLSLAHGSSNERSAPWHNLQSAVRAFSWRRSAVSSLISPSVVTSFSTIVFVSPGFRLRSRDCSRIPLRLWGCAQIPEVRREFLFREVFSRNSFSSIYFHRNHKPNVSVSRENSARFQHVTAALWRHPTPGTGRMPRITGVAVCTTTALVPLTCLIGHNNLKIIISPVLSPTSTFQFYPFFLSLTTNTQRAFTFSVPTAFIGEQKVKLSFGREVYLLMGLFFIPIPLLTLIDWHES